MSDTQDIREAVVNAWHTAFEVEQRPELTDVERESIRIAAKILFETMFDVRARFAKAEPGTTTFSVLAPTSPAR
jgi:hypothetical protein